MAGRGRGKEVALQVEVESQEEWEELISKEGLTGESEVKLELFWKLLLTAFFSIKISLWNWKGKQTMKFFRTSLNDKIN